MFNKILYWFFWVKVDNWVLRMISSLGVIWNKKVKMIIVHYARGVGPN